MDLEKTGALIREQRRALGLTQQNLAGQLHVTDRAVSKWERGLSAPDIALLEPLGEALGLSVVELIHGERAETKDGEEAARSALNYSCSAAREKLRRARKKYALLLAGWTLIALAVGGLLLWRSGVLFRLDRSTSPDGEITVSVYSKELTTGSFSRRDGLSLIENNAGEDAVSRVNYGDCGFGGLWWAPDSEKYVIALEYPEEPRLAVHWVERNSVSNLNAYLMNAVAALGWDSSQTEPSFQFLQWSRDGDSMLIYYQFGGEAGAPRDGYFWYNCETGAADAEYAMGRSK